MVSSSRTKLLGLLAAGSVAAIANGAWGQPAAPGSPPPRDVLIVNRPADDSAKGSLRWALEQSNTAPGHYRILLDGSGAPLHVVLKSSLPVLRSGTIIEGTAHARGLGYDAIDGSGYLAHDPKACPGALPNQFGANVRTVSNPGLEVLDGSRVEISGLEITRFCIGILVWRSDHVNIHDNRITQNGGGAGVMFTGDDGNGNVTPGRTVDNRLVRNELIGNGDGAELTRGAAFNLFADNLFDAGSDNPEPSQGVEILRGDDNVLIRNEFRNYSDGIQVNQGDRNYLAANRLHANAFGLSLTGSGNVADGNHIFDNRFGVVIRSQREAGGARLTRNAIHDNGKPISRCSAGGSCDPLPDPGSAGIVFRMAPVPAGIGAPAAQPVSPANDLPAKPMLKRFKGGSRPTVEGVVRTDDRSTVTVEVFGGRVAGDAETYLGSVTVAPGPGERAFVAPVPQGAWRYLTATATTAAGVTSLLADPIPLLRARR